MSQSQHEEARREAAARKLAALEQRAAALDLSDPDQEWNIGKSLERPSPRKDNSWVPPHRRAADAAATPPAAPDPSGAGGRSAAASDRNSTARNRSGGRAARPEMQRYVPPRVRKEMEAAAAAELEAAAASERKREEELEAAKEAGRTRLRQQEEQRRAASEQRRLQQGGSSGGGGGSASAPAAAAAMSETQRLACILEAYSREWGGGDDLKPRDVHAAIPTAVGVTPLDGGGGWLVAFGSTAAARHALEQPPPGAFKLRAVAPQLSAPAVLRAALGVDVVGSAGGAPRGRDATTASRLITRNIELTRDEKAEARKLVAERKGRLDSERQKAVTRVDAERKRKEEVDAVWDRDE